MPVNPNIDSPTIYPKDLTYDGVLAPTLRAIDVTATGTLVVQDINDKQGIYTFSSVPQRVWLQIRKIIGNGSGGVGNGTTGTDIALANLIGLC